MEGFVDCMLTKHGMADALPSILDAHEGLRAHSRNLMVGAVATLLEASVADGTVRSEIAAEDVMMALGGIALIANTQKKRDLASRLIELTLEGLDAS